MKAKAYNIFPLGTDALTIEWGGEISVALNDRAINLSQYLETNPFTGFVETVPAYCSVTIFYDVFNVRKNFPAFPTAFEAVKYFVETALRSKDAPPQNVSRLIEIPVDFSEEFALDLEFIAAANNLTPHEVIEIFTSQIYRVFMLGFLPAFAYMGEISEKIAAPRKSSPRLLVPRGSVGIAGRQTGIYPFESPGGWQIVGRTEFELFTPNEENPCALQAGDSVRFFALNK